MTPPGDLPLARAFARWVDADLDWERLAPVSSGSVRFRLRPRSWAADDPRLDSLNRRLLEAVQATGVVLVSSAVVGDVYALRLAVVDTPTEEREVRETWAILRAEALRLGAIPPVVA